jgi:hypothetical protein
MVNLGKFVHSKTGKVLMSLLLGMGLATLFRKMCKDKNCIIFYAPPLNNIENKTFKDGNKCYKFNPVATKCDSSKKIVKFQEEVIA